MVKIYRALNLTEAHIVCGLLQHEGIDAVVEGQYLQGGMGELPAMDFAAVSVPDEDESAARKLVRLYESGELLAEDAPNIEPNPSGDES